jgi:hypothetical protein
MRVTDGIVQKNEGFEILIICFRVGKLYDRDAVYWSVTEVLGRLACSE